MRVTNASSANNMAMYNANLRRATQLKKTRRNVSHVVSHKFLEQAVSGQEKWK